SSYGPIVTDAGETSTSLFVESTVMVRPFEPQFETCSRSSALLPGHARVVTSPIGWGSQQGGGMSQLQPQLLLGRGSLIESSRPSPSFVPCSSRSPTAFAASARETVEVPELIVPLWPASVSPSAREHEPARTGATRR